MPKRIQRKRTKGWTKPFLSYCVTRPSYFGNPFKPGVGAPFRFTHDGLFVASKSLRAIPDAEAAVSFFRGWINSRHGLAMANAAREYLRGKDLCCWCPIGSPCHADVLLEIANGSEPK